MSKFFFFVCWLLTPLAWAQPPAFPGAEGFGGNTPGGRGGRVYTVSSLADSGPGTLRAACEASGPRIVVFRVGGTIRLKSAITINSPNITIAGQSAPGDGICVRGHGGYNGILVIKASDVVVRHMRLRVGDDGACRNPQGDCNRDAVTIGTGPRVTENIIFDHCSFSWAIDELAATWFAHRNITFQYCIFGEGLNDRSLHPKPYPHSMALLVGARARRISIHHNLFAHNGARNPRIGNNTTVEIVNNVIYNYGTRGIHLGDGNQDGARQPSYINVVGNYVKAGRNSNRQHACWIWPSYRYHGSKVYVKGNIGPGRPNGHANEWAFVGRNDAGNSVRSTRPAFPLSNTRITDAETAYQQVLRQAGATIPKRDVVDHRLVNDTRRGLGEIKENMAQIGGWPAYRTGTPPPDRDRDGMPDTWELRNKLNPDDPGDASGNRLSKAGYTNVEVYLNSIKNSAPRVASTPTPTTIALGERWAYTLEAKDRDNDPMAITALAKPGWLWFKDRGDGTARLAGNARALGEHPIRIAVSDGTRTVYQSFTLRVLRAGASDRKPCASGPPPTGATGPGPCPTANGQPHATPSAIWAYPNPMADGYCYVELADSAPATVAVYTLQGHCVHEQATHAKTVKIDARGWAKGTYIVVVETAQGTAQARVAK